MPGPGVDGGTRPLDLTRTSTAEQVTALAEALDGGPALLPLPAGRPGDALRDSASAHRPRPGTALLLPTSGSTGEPRLVELPADALRASAAATAARVGGTGPWVLALPLTHVAGWQVVVRGLLAGHAPAVVPPGPFTAAAFTAAATAVAGGARFTSLVPAQLARLLDDPAAGEVLRAMTAVLVGGAATPAALRRRALDAGVPLVRTYGMTETCGGCVYDGVPLDGVTAEVESGGRLVLGGAVLASGYLGSGHEDGSGPEDDHAAGGFVVRDGVRLFRTSDRGHLDGGVLHVDGRLDDQVVTGGVNVSPAAVEAVVSLLAGVRDVVVVGVPDERWGEAVVAVLSATGDGPPDLATVRDAVRDRLGAAAAPQRVVVVDELPVRGIGKPDRAAATEIAAAAVG